MKQVRNLKEGEESLPTTSSEGRKRESRGNEHGSEGEVLEGAVIVFLLAQTVSSYVLFPSLLIFNSKMLRQEYKTGNTGSGDFGQISLLLLLTGSKYHSSHSGPGLSGILHHLPLHPSSSSQSKG